MKHHRSYPLLLAAAVAACLTLSACGGASSDSAAASTPVSSTDPVTSTNPVPPSDPVISNSGGGGSAASAASASSSSSSGGTTTCNPVSGYCAALSVQPATVAPGSAVTIAGSIVAAAAASGMVVDLELDNASGTNLTKIQTPGVGFAAGAPLTLTPATYTIPAGTPAGVYTLKLGIFTSGYASLPYWSNSAATFTVGSTSSSPSSSSSGGTGVCSAASGYCPSISVLPATVAPGSTVTISGSIIAAAAASGMVVDLELDNAAGTNLSKIQRPGTSFTAGAALTLTPATYTIPAGTPAGVYTLKLGIFTSGYASLSYWSNGVATFSVAGTGSTSSSGGGSTSSSSSGGGSSSGTTATGNSAAARLAAKLGLPSRLLLGLGAQVQASTVSLVLSQNLKPDIVENYLVGVSSNDWTTWNKPAGAYVGVLAAQANSVGAIPMYTLYQMAQNGDGVLWGLSSTSFMNEYWANVRLMFQQIAAYHKPALVDFEPDFWGHVEGQASNGDPSKMFAYVNTNPDCSWLSNDVVGIAHCLVVMARKYAPNAYVGFPPSDWGETVPTVVAYMNQLGAQDADFIVMQTSNHDAGCFETMNSSQDCNHGTATGWYWDESNATTPNYNQHFALALAYHNGIGGLPLIWWQTPLGVPSSSPGGYTNHYRDNRVHYFLTHPGDLTAVGGLAVLFSTGNGYQTDLATDGGEYQALSGAYLAAPVALP
jgi:hypothetical protein